MKTSISRASGAQGPRGRSRWRELHRTEDRSEMIGILKLLLEYDEKVGRQSNLAASDLHYLRKALCQVPLERLRIYVQSLGGFVYYVVSEASVRGGRFATSWLHEDGIRVERDQFESDTSHPVHGITCVTDLFERASRTLKQSEAGELARELMSEDHDLLAQLTD